MTDEIKYFVFKANVPLDDHEHMLSWTKSCQAKVPVGHGDYRWGKILNDHLFVERYKPTLDALTDEIKALREELQKEKNSGGLFK